MLVIAHRGASAAAPENTPEAFELADRLGADGVELDVRWWAPTARPPRLVVAHDPLPDDPEHVDSLPDLHDVLDACGSRMLVNVEIKNGDASGPIDPSMAAVGATVQALRDRAADRGDRWLISSFSPETVGHLRRTAPEFPTALLVEGLDVATIDSAARAGHQAIHPDVEASSSELVRHGHDLGLMVTAWTCNDADRIVELAAWGVDAVCTDVPDVALSSLGRTGAAQQPDPRWPWRSRTRAQDRPQ